MLFGGLSLLEKSGDQILSSTVTSAIASLFKQTENLKINIKAEPIAKLFQGKVDGFEFVGQGMLMYNGLRLEAMDLYLQEVAIDFGSVFQGKVELTKSIEAIMRVVLSEDDLTASFNTPFIIEKLQRLTYQGKNLFFQNTNIDINSDRTFNLSSEIRLGKNGEVIPVMIKSEMELQGRTKIQFTNAEYIGDEKSQNLARELINHVNNLLNLENFVLDGTNLTVDKFLVKDKELVFYGMAQINHFPQNNK